MPYIDTSPIDLPYEKKHQKKARQEENERKQTNKNSNNSQIASCDESQEARRRNPGNEKRSKEHRHVATDATTFYDVIDSNP
jgi:hypothetical protein